MKLLKTEIKELIRRPKADGLFTTELEYKVSEFKGELFYTGPKFTPQMWNEILSFFKWTFDTTGGESQVRLFVNPTQRLWKAWAFPQQVSGSLSTRELATEEAQKQRADLFEHQDEWIAWGTVHHHCNIGAFQSGTDEADEKNVGGLHITVGDIDKPRYSLHTRLYHQGDLFEPDMSQFWDIGNILNTLPLEVKALLPAGSEDRIAREQMCVPSVVEFPEQWKENMIKVERSSSMWPEKDGDYKWINQERFQRRNGVWVKAPWEHESSNFLEHESSNLNGKDNKGKDKTRHRRGPNAGGLAPINERCKEAVEELEDELMPHGYTEPDRSDIIAFLKSFIEYPENLVLVDVCKIYHLLPSDLLDLLEEKRAEIEKVKEQSDNSMGYGCQ